MAADPTTAIAAGAGPADDASIDVKRLFQVSGRAYG